MIHNPKVGGSIPPPATNRVIDLQRPARLALLVQSVSTFGTEDHSLNGLSLVSFGGADITPRGLDLRMAHQGCDGEGIKARLSKSSPEGSAEIMPDQTFDSRNP